MQASTYPRPGLWMHNLWIEDSHHACLMGCWKGGVCENAFVKPLNIVSSTEWVCSKWQLASFPCSLWGRISVWREKDKDRETKARERMTDGLRGREGFGAPLGKVGLWLA